ncbi:MAG: hypothetical protein GF308_00975 [Candidatus Heimdallarchaeota archaeon]|nr:hypothetical protein [Candidatus Heimdallarchaeota archaeon]
MSKKIISYIPVLAVVFISLCAFVPSFFIEDINEEVSYVEKGLSELEASYQWITEKARYVFSFDSELYTLCFQKYDEIHYLEHELLHYSSNYTELVNRTYLLSMLRYLDECNVIARQSYSSYIQSYFETGHTEPFTLGRTASGRVYGIRRENWETHQVFLDITLEDFLTVYYEEMNDRPFFTTEIMDLLYEYFPQELQVDYHVFYAVDTPYTLDENTNLYNLTYQPLVDLADEIIITRNDLAGLNSHSEKIERSVTIMTIATLMSTALAARLEERRILHDFSKVRADMNDDPSLIVPEIDRFSLMFLGLAALIAIVGLILTFWF